jgi:hypothetical protein
LRRGVVFGRSGGLFVREKIKSNIKKSNKIKNKRSSMVKIGGRCLFFG